MVGYTVTVETSPRQVAVVQSPHGVAVTQVSSDIEVPQSPRIVEITTGGLQGPPGTPGTNGASSDTTVITASKVNGHAYTLTQGAPVCIVSGVFRLATSAAPFNRVVGLVYEDLIVAGATGRAQVGGIMVQPTAEWDLVTIGVGGLVPEASYFLSANGKLSPYPPETVGDYVVRIGVAISSTDLQIDIADLQIQL